MATVVSLLLAVVLYAVETETPVLILVYVVLLTVPAGFYRVFKPIALPPEAVFGLVMVGTFFAVLAGIGGLLYIPQFGPVRHGGYLVVAAFLMFLSVLRVRVGRLGAADHYLLLLLGGVVVSLGAMASHGAFLIPLLALWAVGTVVALVRINLGAEEDRILDLARVRAFERPDADEVAGRGGVSPNTMLRRIGLIALWVVAAGLLAAWLTPRAAEGLRMAWAWATEGTEQADLLPEAGGVGPPRFSIPKGTTGLLPFGPRLTRSAFRHRQGSDALALLVRMSGTNAPPGRMLIRGECYDYLTGDGRWIRALPRERIIRDSDDGLEDERVSPPDSPRTAGVFLEYLVPPGPDRTLYCLPVPISVGLPAMAVDGTGNLFARGDRAPDRLYEVGSHDFRPVEKSRIREVGPEFTLLPEGVDAAALRAMVEPLLDASTTRTDSIYAIRDWMQRSFVRWEKTTAPPGIEGPEPGRFDVNGFLFERKWGCSVDFATAFAALLRSVGIPCRLVTGYRGGDWLYEADFWVFRAHHAYAWVEVPFAERGWVPFDPSPEELEELDDDELEEVFAAPPEDRAEKAKSAVQQARKPSLFEQLLAEMQAFFEKLLPKSLARPLTWIVLLVMGVLLVRGIAVMGEKGHRFISKRRRKRAGREPPQLPFYDRLLRVLGRAGLRRKRSQTPIEYAREVVERLGDDFADVRRLTNAFCAHRYGTAELSRQAGRELWGRVGRIEQTLVERTREDRRTGRTKVGGVAVLLLLALALAPAAAQEEVPPATLVERLGNADPGVRESGRTGLIALGVKAIPLVLPLLRDAAPGGREEEIARLIADLDADEYRVREEATAALKAVGEAARAALEKVVEEGSPEASRRAAEVLRYLDTEGAVLARDAGAARERARREAIAVLGAVGRASEADAVAQAGLSRPGLVDPAVRALAGIGKRDARGLLRLLDRPSTDLRLIALRALMLVRIPEARPRVILCLAEPGLEAAALRVLVTPAVVEGVDRARLLIAEYLVDEAEAILRKALEDCPGYAEAGLLLLPILVDKEAPDEALEVARSLRLPRDEKTLVVARYLALTGDREAAVARLDDIPFESPAFVDSRIRAAELLLAADPPRVEAALSRARSAAAKASKDPDPWGMVGLILLDHADDREGALEALLKARDLDPLNPRWDRALERLYGR